MRWEKGEVMGEKVKEGDERKRFMMNGMSIRAQEMEGLGTG